MKPSIAQSLRAGVPIEPEVLDLLRVVRAVGGDLEPLHSDDRDPISSRFFSIEVAELAQAEDAVRSLQHSDAVTSAYISHRIETPEDVP